MKVNKLVGKYVDNSVRKQKEDLDKNNPVAKDTDKVEISSSAKSLVKRINQSEDSAYSEKVEKIRKSIQDGAYKVSPEKIADKIMQEMESQSQLGDE